MAKRRSSMICMEYEGCESLVNAAIRRSGRQMLDGADALAATRQWARDETGKKFKGSKGVTALH
jgi:hypothetical protein